VQAIGIHHVSVNVDDVGKAAAFYVDVLGLRRRDDRPDFGFDGAWLDCGAQQVHLIEGAVPEGLGQHFAFAVADLDGVVAQLRADGVEVTDPRPVGPGRQAFLHDPSGNMVELNEPA
jgi:glyoxylase I family protein